MAVPYGPCCGGDGMSERIDHEAEAERLLRDSEHLDPQDGAVSAAMFAAMFAAAQVHATLALVAEQREANRQARIANLIAYAAHRMEHRNLMPEGGVLDEYIAKVDYETREELGL